MATSTAPTLAGLSDVTRWRARGEWFEIARMLDYRDAEMARTAHTEPAMRRQVERSMIALTIGEAMNLSEGQVQYKLAAADRVREKTPTVWEAFADGVIDFARVRDIASTIDKLHREESVFRLDRLVVAYAADHTAAELRTWLRRFVQRVEADLAVERAETERQDRHVCVKHGDDGMSDLYARLPSHELAAIEARLRTEARTPVDDDDQRTVAQREADLLIAWCTGSQAATSAISANIAVTIAADVLAGAVAAHWIADVIATGSTFWHRIVTEPVTGDVLSHEYVGRYAPDVLDIALQFLHEVGRAPGCMVPARYCDNDHRVPHPEGPTTAANMGPFCRRHHQAKGHGFLRWTTGPPPRTKPLVVELYAPNPAFPMEYAV